ncbi:hypothetical protein [Mycolicibacterium sp. S3B2]|uniref:hypothetical protein n=1 Tax=Mycolicibacterium sp. S3B2 TaxID=3415120 RepID=UPI003C7E9A49
MEAVLNIALILLFLFVIFPASLRFGRWISARNAINRRKRYIEYGRNTAIINDAAMREFRREHGLD